MKKGKTEHIAIHQWAIGDRWQQEDLPTSVSPFFTTFSLLFSQVLGGCIGQ